MNFLKFLMLLALALWIGGIVFFTSIEAPTILGHVNDRVLAGAMISQSLWKLHTLGMVCGMLFLAASLGHSRVVHGEFRMANGSNLTAALMIGFTAVSQYGILPAIARLRVVEPTAQQFAEFQRLHNWSVGLEAATLLLGVSLLCMTARRLS
jgi:hypothetical protein